MEIAGAIEPRLVVEAGDFDHQRIAFPATDRLAHPGIRRRRARVLHVDVAHRARVLVSEEHIVLALEDLERIGHVGRPRHAGQVALDLGIEREPVLLVLLLLLQRFGLVRNRVAVDDAEPGGYRADRAHRDHLRRRHRHELARHHRDRGARCVRLDVVVRRVERLPDTVQIRPSVFQSRPLGGCLRGQCSGRDEHGGRSSQQNARKCVSHRFSPPRCGDKTMRAEHVSIQPASRRIGSAARAQRMPRVMWIPRCESRSSATTAY